MGNIGIGVASIHLPSFLGRIASLLASGSKAANIPETGGVLVYNASGGALSAGDIVYLDGVDSTSGCLKAYKAQAATASKQAQFVILESIASTATGPAAVGGVVTTSLDTSSAAVGDPVYLSTTAGGLTLTGGVSSTLVGYVDSVSTTGKVRFALTQAAIHQARQHRLSVLTAAGTAHTNSTDETVLASATIAANTIKAGTRVRIRFKARVTADNGATTLTGRLRFGTTTLTGTELIVTSATDTASGHLFMGEFWLTGRAAPGPSSAIVGNGWFNQPAAAGGALVTANLNTTNFATNGALRVELTAAWSAADANSVQAEEFSVDIFDS